METNGKKPEKAEIREKLEQAGMRKLRDQLDNELSQVQFDEMMKKRVLQRATRSLWEREIRISGPVAFAVCLLLVGAGALMFAQSAKHAPLPRLAGHELKNGTNSNVQPERRFVVLNSGVYSEEMLREGWDK